MNPKKQLIVVMGPTASGKTSFAIELAKRHNSSVFSADSRQFYKELNIGVARPNDNELNQAEHYFIGHKSIFDNYTAGDFEKECLDKLNEYFKTKDVAILVGGSGLFIKAVVEGLDSFPEVDPKIRVELNEQLAEKGLQPLLNKLEKLDKDSFESIEKDNPRRVIRALEVCISSGSPFSYYKKQAKAPRNFTVKKIGLQWERDALYQRINKRVDAMMEEGLEQEARMLYPNRHLNTLKTVGYTEMFEYFEGNYKREFAIEKIKQHTRNYAKRQLTWLRKEDDILIKKRP